jgi:simple sugar transport system ATP-binding protein
VTNHDVLEDTERDSLLLVVRDLHKSFGSVQALRGASLYARRGEVTTIVGDNGAGKSTFIKCVVGVHRPDAGATTFNGQLVTIDSPGRARSLGIETVYQDLALIEDLTVWENMFLSRELTTFWGRLLNKREMLRRSADIVAQLGVSVPSVRARVRKLSGGQRQAVAIGRALGWGAKLIVMDEPTAALGVRERTEVEDLILRLRNEGRTFLIISHDFQEVIRLSDAIWVMRHGAVVAQRRSGEVNMTDLVALVTGATQEIPMQSEAPA